MTRWSMVSLIGILSLGLSARLSAEELTVLPSSTDQPVIRQSLKQRHLPPPPPPGETAEARSEFAPPPPEELLSDDDMPLPPPLTNRMEVPPDGSGPRFRPLKEELELERLAFDYSMATSDSDRKVLKEKIRAKANEAFDHKARREEKMLRQMEKKLGRIKEIHAKRLENRDKIIEWKIQELLKPRTLP